MPPRPVGTVRGLIAAAAAVSAEKITCQTSVLTGSAYMTELLDENAEEKLYRGTECATRSFMFKTNLKIEIVVLFNIRQATVPFEANRPPSLKSSNTFGLLTSSNNFMAIYISLPVTPS